MKNIMLLGAFIDNKGAQSMIFTVVDEIKKKYPSANVYILTNYDFDEEINKIYNFKFIKINIKDKLRLSGNIFTLLSLIVKGKYNKLEQIKLKQIINEVDLFIDVSGFALSSKFSRNNTINYLSQISLAQKFNKPIILFPQSFGPFDYNMIEKPFIKFLIKKYLGYPIKIYAREKEGYEYLKSLNLNNIELAVDTVFYKKDAYNLNNLFRGSYSIKKLNIEENSVAIIPNIKILNKHNENFIYELYNKTINNLIKLNKNVYLIRHSVEDLKIIEKIHQDFVGKNVYLIKEEYNAIELHCILEQFDFVIASRYHSIVHSYKAGTPALVIGWAIKYKELLEKFDQSKYQFDISHLEIKDFISKLKEMNDNYEKERYVILKKLNSIYKNNIFDLILND